MRLFGLFLCSCPLPPVLWPASRIILQAFFVLIPTGHPPISPPHDATLPALQTCPEGTLGTQLSQSTSPISLMDLFQPFKVNLPMVNLADGNTEVLTLIVRHFQYLKVSLIVFRVKGH